MKRIKPSADRDVIEFLDVEGLIGKISVEPVEQLKNYNRKVAALEHVDVLFLITEEIAAQKIADIVDRLRIDRINRKPINPKHRSIDADMMIDEFNRDDQRAIDFIDFPCLIVEFDDAHFKKAEAIARARETYVKCRIDAGGGTLEVKLPSKEIIRAERLDDDRIDQLLQDFTPRKNYWQAFEGSSAKLIELFPVEFFREDDLDANPSAFNHDGNIRIYAECRRDHYSLQNIVLKLPEYEELRLRRGQRLSARLLGDPQRRRGRRATFYFPNGV